MEQGLGQKSAEGVPKQHLLLPLCQFGAIEPGVASEYLISALAGKGNFVVLLNQAAEVEQRRIHIRHTRQVFGVHSIVQQLGGATLAQVMQYINLSVKNEQAAVTAALLNYKNEHFPDFDPMEEYTLDNL